MVLHANAGTLVSGNPPEEQLSTLDYTSPADI